MFIKHSKRVFADTKMYLKMADIKSMALASVSTKRSVKHNTESRNKALYMRI